MQNCRRPTYRLFRCGEKDDVHFAAAQNAADVFVATKTLMGPLRPSPEGRRDFGRPLFAVQKGTPFSLREKAGSPKQRAHERSEWGR